MYLGSPSHVPPSFSISSLSLSLPSPIPPPPSPPFPSSLPSPSLPSSLSSPPPSLLLLPLPSSLPSPSLLSSLPSPPPFPPPPSILPPSPSLPALHFPFSPPMCRQNILQFVTKYGEVVSFRFHFKAGAERAEPRGYCFVEYSTREVSNWHPFIYFSMWETTMLSS